MNWREKQLLKHQDEKRAQRVKELALQELMSDKNFSRILKEQFDYGYDKGIEDGIEQAKDQVRMAFFCAARVAMEYEKIKPLKAQTILALIDEYSNQDKTAEEFLDWCERETGMRFEMR